MTRRRSGILAIRLGLCLAALTLLCGCTDTGSAGVNVFLADLLRNMAAALLL